MSERRGYLAVGKRERDMLGCSHCRKQIEVPVGRDAIRLDRCGQCAATICGPCASELTRTVRCAPFEKRLEAVERRAALRKALLLSALFSLVSGVARADSLIRPVQVTTARPTCTADREGTQWTSRGGVGVASSTSVCEKLANGTYSWVALDSASGGGSGTPASAVTSETTFGASSAVGTSTDYARADHTHGTPADPVTAHVAAADPHTGYQKESERGTASGYAPLDGSSLVPVANLPALSALSGSVTDGQIPATIARDAELPAPTLFARIATSDYTNSTVTPSNIAGLSFPLEASSIYSFGCELHNASAAATTGVRPGLTYSGTSAHLRMTCQIPASASALAWFTVTTSGNSCDATASQGTGLAQIYVTGTIETTNAGTLQIQGESEVAASQITIHRGSFCWARKH